MRAVSSFPLLTAMASTSSEVAVESPARVAKAARRDADATPASVVQCKRRVVLDAYPVSEMCLEQKSLHPTSEAVTLSSKRGLFFFEDDEFKLRTPATSASGRACSKSAPRRRHHVARAAGVRYASLDEALFDGDAASAAESPMSRP